MARTISKVLFAALLLLAAPVPAAEPVGFVASLEGDVDVRRTDGAWQAARTDTDVAIGDRIRTGFDSRARILLADDTLLQIDEDTEFQIQSFHVGAAATKERSVIKQLRGRMRTQVGRAFGGETRLEVHTPNAVVGVKGTDFETSDIGKGLWSCCLHSGAILVSNGAGSGSPAPGFCLNVGPDLPPGVPYRNPGAPLVADDERRVSDADFLKPAGPGARGLELVGELGNDDDLIDVELQGAPAVTVRSSPVGGPPCCAVVAGP